MQTLQVQAYSLIDFLQEYEKAKAEGFEMSTDSGYAPIEIGGFYVTVMVKKEQSSSVVQEEEVVVQAQQSDTSSSDEDKEDTPVVKRGRKPKA